MATNIRGGDVMQMLDVQEPMTLVAAIGFLQKDVLMIKRDIKTLVSYEIHRSEPSKFSIWVHHIFYSDEEKHVKRG